MQPEDNIIIIRRLRQNNLKNVSPLYFPMPVFSGTTLPAEVMPQTMRKIASLFPLTPGISLMKHSYLGVSTGNVLIPVTVMVVVMLLCPHCPGASKRKLQKYAPRCQSMVHCIHER